MKNQRGYIDWESIIGLSIIVIIVLAVVGTVPAAMWMDRYACLNRAEEMKLDGKWGPVMGCRVEVQGRYVPMSMIRITDTGEIIVTGNDGD